MTLTALFYAGWKQKIKDASGFALQVMSDCNAYSNMIERSVLPEIMTYSETKLPR